jgi:cation diffusion facilitator CzcD-associated flavoprotein CzcO
VAQTVLKADYVVVGAGAMGMAFTDALVEHADVSVVLVDRRHSVSGHWLNAYPFVRLTAAAQRFRQLDGPGLAKLATLADMHPTRA